MLKKVLIDSPSFVEITSEMAYFFSKFFISKKSSEGALHVVIILAKIWQGNWSSSKIQYKSWRVILWQLLVWSLTKSLRGNKTNWKTPQKSFCQRYKIYGLNEGRGETNKQTTHLILTVWKVLVVSFGGPWWGGKMKGPSWDPQVTPEVKFMRLNMHSSLCSTCHYLGAQ